MEMSDKSEDTGGGGVGLDDESHVVELGDSEDEEEASPRRRLVTVWQCLNPECTVNTRLSLTTVDSFALSYYGMRPDPKKKRKICPDCRVRVAGVEADLLDKLRSNTSLFQQKLPVSKDLVLLEDSDEEPQTDSSGESEFEVECGGGSDSSDSEAGTAEEKLSRIIGERLDQAGLGFQLDSATADLTARLDSVKPALDETEQMFRDLEKEVDSLRSGLYKNYEPRIREMTPVDLSKETAGAAVVVRTNSSFQPSTGAGAGVLSGLPAAVPAASGAPVSRPPLTLGQECFAMRGSVLQAWSRATVVEAKPGPAEYRVRLEGRGQIKPVTGRQVAYAAACPVRLPVGLRVIALFREQPTQPGAFYSGIIAEPPKIINKQRYLVFFDDGYASYIAHKDVRVVCRVSAAVWDDVHPNSREFIRDYLTRYPERPMVKLSQGQVVKTEWDSKWWITRVLQVDASLVRLVFDADKRTEWIYRGSTRLGPLFTELEQQKMRRQQAGQTGVGQTGATQSFVRRTQTTPAKRRNGPYIEYKRDDPQEQPAGGGAAGAAGAGTKRAVARKSSTAVGAGQVRRAEPAVRWETEGSVFQTEVRPVTGVAQRAGHTCSARCQADLRLQYREQDHRTTNLLLVPIILGWAREVARHRTEARRQGKRKVFYTAPCGRRLRSLEEVHRYLRMTDSDLEIDFFNFDWWLHVHNEFKPAREFCTIKDLSYGKESIPISCVNSIDRSYPEYVEYSTVRLPQRGVHINTDTAFLTCCDCTDDCKNKAKCACWQLTIQNTACDRDATVQKDVGYQHRRLPEIVLTGIYECNPNCACSKTCLNRVVQKPLRQRLQVFKTEKRGWGIRTLHDIPQGAFLAIYVGNLYSSEEANKQGQNFGDEYFAELDMIEVIERRKDGYESDVSDEGFDDDPEIPKLDSQKLSSDENSTEEDQEEDQDFRPDAFLYGGDDGARTNRSSRSRAGVPQFDGAGEEEEDEAGRPSRRGGFSATVGIAGPQEPQAQRFTSARRLYGREEDVYIMDAKSIGNIGRYLNHSCNPNVFVQNVFVDTHDLRFPWISFFASAFIRAGQELSWDYNYEVGSIPGKELYCSCGSEQCRGKLL